MTTIAAIAAALLSGVAVALVFLAVGSWLLKYRNHDQPEE